MRRSDQRLGLLPGLALLLLALAVGCQRSGVVAPRGDEAPWFTEVTQEVGLNFVHDAGPSPGNSGPYFLPQIIGSGAALFDFDNDGRLDILLLQNGGPHSQSRHRLFHQEADGHFTDVSAGSGLDFAGYGMGVAIGDVNNDGLPDVYISEYGGARLFLNQGHGKFLDVTREAGLTNPLWGTSACFVDFDRDGWLDLVVVNYVDFDPSNRCVNEGGRPDYCHPNSFPGTVTKLFRNLGPVPGSPGQVRFEDVTVRAGLGRVTGSGLGVVCADFNGDRWPDIFVANDARPNRLWINQRDGTFKEEGVVRGVAYNGLGLTQGNMGIALGDVDGDGHFDLFVTHLAEEYHVLYKQGPRGFFQDRTTAAGLANPAWRGTGFGTVLGDFNQDGSLDLAIVNGRVAKRKSGSEPSPSLFWTQYAERNQLFANDGSGKFRDISPQNASFCGTAAISRALCYGDVDGDGALDLLVTEIGGPAHLFRNVAPHRGHWLMVRALDPALRRDAYGAEVTVECGSRRWTRLLNPGSSYLSSNDPRCHFGLGEAQHVDRIEVVWPDGSEERFPGGPLDRLVEVRRGEGRRPSGGKEQ